MTGKGTDLQAKLQELRDVYLQASELHKSALGSVKTEMERVMNDVKREIQELERKIEETEGEKD